MYRRQHTKLHIAGFFALEAILMCCCPVPVQEIIVKFYLPVIPVVIPVVVPVIFSIVSEV